MTTQGKVELYVQKWVEVFGSHISVEFAHSVVDPFERMRVRCNKCNQTLTCNVPETPEKIDWALQKFVGLHRHEPKMELVNISSNSTPMAIPVTADFKPVKTVRKQKEGRRFRETN